MDAIGLRGPVRRGSRSFFFFFFFHARLGGQGRQEESPGRQEAVRPGTSRQREGPCRRACPPSPSLPRLATPPSLPALLPSPSRARPSRPSFLLSLLRLACFLSDCVWLAGEPLQTGCFFFFFPPSPPSIYFARASSRRARLTMEFDYVHHLLRYSRSLACSASRLA